METILMEVLKFIGTSMAGGFTWDVLKGSGSRILTGFKERFIKAKHFQDESQAEQFLKDISSKESINKRHPLEDVWAVYDNCTGREADDSFQTEFKNWINNHREDFEHLGQEAGLQNGIAIQKQVNRDRAQVTNIVNQYNYGGNRRKSERSDK